MMKSEGGLALEGVSLRFDPSGPDVLRDISFAVPAGAFRWLTGASGAGKTSLLKLLTLAVRPTGGRLRVLDTPVEKARRRQLPALRRRIGMVFQDYRLLPHLSAFDNVALPLRLARRRERQVQADVAEMLRWVGLGHCFGAYPAELSGGEQQRVAIARSVITRPSLLLADEPTGNLDERQAERLMQLLGELNRLGTTIVVATHQESLVRRHPAHTLVIEAGRIIGETDPPATPEQARLGHFG
jgi:cell division transport system ATP-binding protein